MSNLNIHRPTNGGDKSIEARELWTGFGMDVLTEVGDEIG